MKFKCVKYVNDDGLSGDYKLNKEKFPIGKIFKFEDGDVTSLIGYNYGERKTTEETLAFLSDWYIFEEVKNKRSKK